MYKNKTKTTTKRKEQKHDQVFLVYRNKQDVVERTVYMMMMVLDDCTFRGAGIHGCCIAVNCSYRVTRPL